MYCSSIFYPVLFVTVLVGFSFCFYTDVSIISHCLYFKHILKILKYKVATCESIESLQPEDCGFNTVRVGLEPAEQHIRLKKEIRRENIY